MNKFFECLHKEMKRWGSAILPWFTIAAAFVTGWWAYHNFSITATDEWDPEIKVVTEVMPYDAQTALLIVHVCPKNIGKVPIVLRGGNKGDISVSVNELPTGHAPGRIMDEELILFNDEIKSLAKENNGEYGLMPSVEYDDIQYFVIPTPKGKESKIYVVSAEFDWPYDGNDPDQGYSVDGYAVVRLTNPLAPVEHRSCAD